jgi:hypothetical protein
MKKHYSLKLNIGLFLLVAILLVPMAATFAQSHLLSVSTDLYSRYVWRGFDFGDSPSIQPSMAFTSGNFEIGVWGAFATNAHGNNPAYRETDLNVAYSIPINTGSLSLGVTDYFFPTPTTDYFLFNDNHVYEANIGITFAKSFPLSISGNINFAGRLDPQGSTYIELDYPVSTATLTFGFIPMKSDYYGLSKAGVVNVGISDTKDIQITDKFSLPLHGSLLVNPYTKKIYFLAGVSF